ncbi:glycosyltransferase [Oleiharenicola sp. Vm1]|uniref:glycosyltransferase n=1 Tax=Oleiharenicola sp. Vm1 TaxID=3398393 RepID=UPI0039F47116
MELPAPAAHRARPLRGRAHARAAGVAEFLGEHARGRLCRLLLPRIPPRSARSGARRLGRRARDCRLAALAHPRPPVQLRRARLRPLRARRRLVAPGKTPSRALRPDLDGVGRQFLLERGLAPEKIVTIRRGLAEFPALKPLRAPRRPLRLLCVARLVEKKGLEHQLRIYAALRAAGFAFEARIVGDGPLRAELKARAAALGVAGDVTFRGQLPHAQVWTELAWADVLLHTGIVAPSGDRDGLPNVIPEAMAAGVIVVSSPVSATTEAVQQERTGLVADVDLPLAWRIALERLASDDALAETLRRNARAWVEQNYDARKNTARLIDCFAAARR